MVFGRIFFAIICWFCTLIIGAIALWAFKRRDPMHFWAGTTINPEEIADIPRYNRANGILWAVYAAFYFVAGIASLFSETVAVIMVVIGCFPGVIVLMVAYSVIYHRYKIRSS